MRFVFVIGWDSKNPSNNLSIIKIVENMPLKNKKQSVNSTPLDAFSHETPQFPAKIHLVHWRPGADPDAPAAFSLSGV
jgi:hypothetical protein